MRTRILDRLAGGGAWLSVACVAGLLMEPYAPGRLGGSLPVRDLLNVLSDLALALLPVAFWLHDPARTTRGGLRALGFGAVGVGVWVAADVLSGLGRESVSTVLGAIASGLLAVWIFLACRRGVATSFLPRLLGSLGLWAIPGLVLMTVILALSGAASDSSSSAGGPPPFASVLVFYVLLLGPFWVWLVLVGGYLMHYPVGSQPPESLSR